MIAKRELLEIISAAPYDTPVCFCCCEKNYPMKMYRDEVLYSKDLNMILIGDGMVSLNKIIEDNK